MKKKIKRTLNPLYISESAKEKSRLVLFMDHSLGSPVSPEGRSQFPFSIYKDFRPLLMT